MSFLTILVKGITGDRPLTSKALPTAITIDPRAESLGQDRARKNWNSIGDHAPAYLINLWLATGEDKYADFLVSIADTIVQHFPDYEHSPFVQERYNEDWTPDATCGKFTEGLTNFALKDGNLH